jgi:hypothetical protein
VVFPLPSPRLPAGHASQSSSLIFARALSKAESQFLNGNAHASALIGGVPEGSADALYDDGSPMPP